MAGEFRSGAIVGTATLDDSQWIAGVNRVVDSSGKMEKSTKESLEKISKHNDDFATKIFKSMFTAQAAYDLVKKALTAVINVGKQSIQEYAKQEKAEKQLAIALGFTSKALLNQANEMQNLVGVSDDAITQGQAFLAQLGLTENQILSLTPSIIDFAQATGQDLSEAFRMVGQSTGTGRNMLAKYGIDLKDVSEKSEKLSLITQGLTEKFGGQAAAVRDTWTGAMTALDNTTGNLLETFGRFGVVIGRDIVEGMIASTQAINDFITKGENLQKTANFISRLAAGFQLFKDIMDGIFKGVGMTIFKDVDDDLKELVSTGEKAGNRFSILSGAITGINIALKIVGGYLNIVIKYWINLFTAIKDVAFVAGKFFEAVADPKKWGAVWTQIQKVGTDFKDLGQDFFNGAKDIVGNVVKEFSTLPDSINKQTDALVNNYDKAYQKYYDKLTKTNDAIIDNENKKNQTIIEMDAETKKKLKDEFQKWEDEKSQKTVEGLNKQADLYKQAGVKASEVDKWLSEQLTAYYAKGVAEVADLSAGVLSTFQNTGNKLADAIGNIGQSVMEGISNIAQNLDSVGGAIASTAEAIGAVANSIADAINEAQQEKAQAQIENINQQSEERIAKYEEEKEKALAIIEDQYNQETEILNQNLANGLISQDQYNQQKKALEDQKRADEEAVKQKAQAKEEAEKEKAKKKRNETAKAAFEAEKANKIAMLWVNYAIGLVGIWAQSIAQLGPIAGAIMAGVLTGVLTGVAIAETVVISQQNFIPEKAVGGMASGITRVNEKGGEIITLPDGSQVVPNDISRQIAANASPSKSDQIINVSFDGAQISNNMDLEYVADYVSKKLGKQIGM